MIVIATDRLLLREIEESDAAFIHALLTDADFLAQIGDRGVKTLADAARSIHERYRASYAELGFGFYAVVRREGGGPIGIAGLTRRPGLAHPDVGYALLPGARGQGFALEAVRGVMAWAAARGIAPVVAIMAPGNARSIAILEGIGLVADRRVRMPGEDHDVMRYVPAGVRIG